MWYKLIIKYCHFIVRNGNHNSLLSILIKILKKKNESLIIGNQLSTKTIIVTSTGHVLTSF